jgi:hypothetical protein
MDLTLLMSVNMFVYDLILTTKTTATHTDSYLICLYDVMQMEHASTMCEITVRTLGAQRPLRLPCLALASLAAIPAESLLFDCLTHVMTGVDILVASLLAGVVAFIQLLHCLQRLLQRQRPK